MIQLLDVAPPTGENFNLTPNGKTQRDSKAAYLYTFPSWLDNKDSANHHSRHIQGFYRGILGKFESYLPDKMESVKINLRHKTNKLCSMNNCMEHHHLSTNQKPDLSINVANQIGSDNSVSEVTPPPVYIPSQFSLVQDGAAGGAILYERYYQNHAKSKTELKLLEDHGFLQFSYNVTASDLIPINRRIEDSRPNSCPTIDSSTPFNDTVSVVITVHNEARSVLIRTLTSILRQTDLKLLRQVIVVFDNETDTSYVEDYFKDNNIFLFLHTTQREGLVRSRLLGAAQAEGSVLIFLDSHCECNINWLEPLLLAIAQNRNKIVSPYIDTIRPDTFQYVQAPANLQGGFNWHLDFVWQAIPYHKYTQRLSTNQPIRTPTISGGLFAIDRDYFFRLGSYDDKMDIWGGENIELSFRAWMCGGLLEILPCSRVGHVFRSVLPHSFPDGGRQTVARNLRRVAEVWMDDYKNIFYSSLNIDEMEVGDIQERQTLRTRLKCKSFQWYLQNVIPELSVPDQSDLAFGEFRHQLSLQCLTVQSNGRIILAACQGQKNTQVFSLTSHGDLHLYNSSHDNNSCIRADNKKLHLGACGHHIWTLQGQQIQQMGSELCLGSEDHEIPVLVPCDFRPESTWDVTYKFHHKRKIGR
ncbi:hypothetical protein SNE40_022252 [Patella caerulea]|uniref:Polypeptide N-acetylgalactosaminyltransferase n=1 Tax=Patella caerulea TaxID=87958 RepID=A0AAN8FZZ9_PATCE